MIDSTSTPLRLHHSPPPARRAHLVGIAGAGMSALADVLRGRAWSVSGSDLCPVKTETGVFAGHAAEQVPADVDLVVYSDAIPADNCERQRAAELPCQTLSYAQMLGRLASGGRGLAVAGTHGKSTTTAMAAEILLASGLDPTVVSGACPIGKPSGGRAGQGALVLVEACEYRANFLHLRPRAAVILNVEPDHFDCYASEQQLHDAFAAFARQAAAGGVVLAGADCPAALRVTEPVAARRETFGLSRQADWQARDLLERDGRYRFNIYDRDEPLCPVQLSVPGRHNVVNALAAAALAHAAGATPLATRRGLERFRGLHRRLEEAGRIGPARWIDDYAHHPTEVTASLATARTLAPGGRVWCVFQPHQAGRTARLLDGFARSLKIADKVWVAEIFRSREGPPTEQEAAAADLAARLAWAGGRVVSGVHEPAAISAALAAAVARGELTPHDIIITMGAGNIWKVGHELSQRFREHRAAG